MSEEQQAELEVVQDAPIDDSSPSPASEAETAPETSEAEKPKKNNGVQDRIHQLTREKHEARQKAERAEEANSDLTKRLEALESANKAPEASKPQESDFDDYSEYQKADSDYVVSKATQGAYDRIRSENLASAKATSEAERATAIKAKHEAFQEKVAAKRESYQDYEEVAYGHNFMDQDMAEQLFDMEKGVEVGYYLGSHLDIAEKVLAMTPIERARELTKSEFQVESVKPKTVSDAPDPITPLGSSEKVTKHEKDMGDEEWMKARYAQLNAKISQ